MKPRPSIVRTLDAHLYTEIAGELRKNLPGHVMLDLDRGIDENGKRIVTLRCRYPEVAKRAIAKVLGEEYAEPEIKDLPPDKHRQWWQRSIDSGMGGGRSRDSGSLQRSWAAYAKGFQADIERTSRRISKATRGYEEDVREGTKGFKKKGKWR